MRGWRGSMRRMHVAAPHCCSVVGGAGEHHCARCSFHFAAHQASGSRVIICMCTLAPLLEGTPAAPLAIRPLTGWGGPAGGPLRDPPKRSIWFETKTSSGKDKDVALLGLPAESKWILTGSYYDRSLVRCALGYELMRRAGMYAPRTRFVELLVAHDASAPQYPLHYQGIYLLNEAVSRGAERVDVGASPPPPPPYPQLGVACNEPSRPPTVSSGGASWQRKSDGVVSGAVR
ncbi:hypothetical protein CYMTET_3796 [Cymbomonas tetramitiformis]|uniref:Uncharacterized protein n=1 Tax=Cymbomonas tetramitiformis TaxID=36881 RepID=A0AAE0H2F4_9CHLO|nr:hypothetical protein CYMTET_3796 [Cymbomonas tetramitiformis]